MLVVSEGAGWSGVASEAFPLFVIRLSLKYHHFDDFVNIKWGIFRGELFNMIE